MKPAVLLLPVILLAASSCSNVLQKDYKVTAIDTDERPIFCVIYTDSQLVNNAANDPVLTPVMVRLTFKRMSDGTGYEPVLLGVRSVEVGTDGKITKGLREGEGSRFRADERPIQPSDAKNQTFILLKDPTYN